MTVNSSAYLVLTVNGIEVKHIKSFPYLGSTVTIDGGDLEDIHTYIKKANGDFVSCTEFGGLKISFLEQTLGCLIKIVTKWISNSLQVFEN